jgi:Tfp pilus assembly protein PilE
MVTVKLIKRVPASSILEVIVSMVIIVVVFGIAMMIYTNVLRLSLFGKKLKAQAMLQEAMLKAEQDPQSIAETVTADGFRIEQQAKPYEGNPGLSVIILAAFDQNEQKIAELQKVLRNNP